MRKLLLSWLLHHQLAWDDESLPGAVALLLKKNKCSCDHKLECFLLCLQLSMTPLRVCTTFICSWIHLGHCDQLHLLIILKKVLQFACENLFHLDPQMFDMQINEIFWSHCSTNFSIFKKLLIVYNNDCTIDFQLILHTQLMKWEWDFISSLFWFLFLL